MKKKIVVERSKTGVILINVNGELVDTYYPSTIDQSTIDLLETLAEADELVFNMPKLELESKSQLLYYREKAGLTLEQLADKVGCTRQTLSKIELRQTIPRLDLAVKIADVLRIDARTILE